MSSKGGADLPGLLWDIFESDPTPCFVLDSDNKVLALNHSATQLAGDLVGSSFLDILDLHRP